MARELARRSEVREEDTWNLGDLYPSGEAWEEDLEKILQLTADLVSLEGKVGESAESLFRALKDFSEIERLSERTMNYAQRLYDEDTGNTEHQAMSARVMGIYAQAGSETAFLDPELIAIPEETLDAFYLEKPELKEYRNYLTELRRKREHMLDAAREKLLAMTLEMCQTPSETYSLLNNADMQFPEIVDENGDTVRITHGRFIRLLESGDRQVRRQAFEKYYATYRQFLNTCASLYDGQVKQQIFHARARKYDSTLEAAVDRNHVPVKVYLNLIDTVNEHLDTLHRYVKLRKRCLGVKELHMYDIYTPMVSDVAKKISFEEAKETVLKALAPLGEDYLKVLREAFANRWIDVYENQGKRSGAYSAGAYGTHPYVLLNYGGSLDDMFTLAHEMGHAMHSYYSDQSQPFLDSQYKIFVAEVASTCNEVLLLEYLLAHTQDKKEKAYLLNHYLDMFKGTLFRQTQFAEFELESNRMLERGEGLNAGNLSELYLELNKKYYGEDMVSDPEIAYEWARIPHFYYEFYVYQYATSFAAAVSIAHEILEKGQEMTGRYREFLSSGCSKEPVELLKMVGVNMETPEPIKEALQVMDGVLDHMEELLFE